jgi:hypothetical protein
MVPRAVPDRPFGRLLLLEGGGTELQQQPRFPVVRERVDSIAAMYTPLFQALGISLELGGLTATTAGFVARQLYAVRSVQKHMFAAPLQRSEPPMEPEALPFLVAARRLIELDKVGPAKQMLDAAPAYILSDPMVAKLRAILAPPLITRVRKRDVDRTAEYEWLRTQGSKHRGRWVALQGKALLAEATTLRDLCRALEALTLVHPPLLHRVD